MGRSVGDCAVRAISAAMGMTWEDAYAGLSVEGFTAGDLPNADSVWGSYLHRHGFRRHLVEELDATAETFARRHPRGVYVLSMPGRHVLTIRDGRIMDAWDSRQEVPTYYWSKED